MDRTLVRRGGVGRRRDRFARGHSRRRCVPRPRVVLGGSGRDEHRGILGAKRDLKDLRERLATERTAVAACRDARTSNTGWRWASRRLNR